MVCLLPVALYGATTDVTSTASLGKNLDAFASGKRLSDQMIAQFELALAPCLTKRTKMLDKLWNRLKGIGCAHVDGLLFSGGGKSSFIIVLLIVGRVWYQIT
jgi:hypothetical protein